MYKKSYEYFTKTVSFFLLFYQYKFNTSYVTLNVFDKKEGYIMQIIGDSLKKIIYDRSAWENAAEGINITTPQNDFNSNVQITGDSVDLRISDHGYVMNKKYKYINTLSQDSFDKHFDEVSLNLEGYILAPGDILYIGTLERISLKGPIIGRISGRTTYARLGLSINISHDKFCGSNNAIVGLQLQNNSNQNLKIYPYQKLAQILFYRTEGKTLNLAGTYANESEYRLPQIADKERFQYDKNTAEKIAKTPSKKLRVFGRWIEKLKNTKTCIKVLNVVLVAFGTITPSIINLFQISNKEKIAIYAMFAFVYIVFSIFINVFIDDGKD